MYGYLEISGDMARRLRCRSAYATVLLAILLSGCASFSPDGGMRRWSPTSPSKTIGKDVVSIRTEDDAERAKGIVQGLFAETWRWTRPYRSRC